MRKPVSKHALRRALDQAKAEGVLAWDAPTGTVVDRIWHLVEKDAFTSRRRDVPRESLRDAEPVEA
jgi:hypothetical protein